MTSRQQLITVVAVFCVVIAGWIILNKTLGHEIKPLGIGSTAPEFVVNQLDEEGTASLSDYKGNVVMLNIWATWCAPCRAEMPSMQKLHEEFAPKGLKIVAVSIDDENSVSSIRSFIKDYGLSFTVLHNPSGDIQRTYQTTGVPETIIIGKDGKIRTKVSGAVDWHSDANRKLIESLINR